MYTHYLHHFFYREEAGRWLLVWRRIDASNPRLAAEFPSAQERGDRTTMQARSPARVGYRRTFRPLPCRLVRDW